MGFHWKCNVVFVSEAWQQAAACLTLMMPVLLLQGGKKQAAGLCELWGTLLGACRHPRSFWLGSSCPSERQHFTACLLLHSLLGRGQESLPVQAAVCRLQSLPTAVLLLTSSTDQTERPCQCVFQLLSPLAFPECGRDR